MCEGCSGLVIFEKQCLVRRAANAVCELSSMNASKDTA